MMENEIKQPDEVDGLIAHLDQLLKQRREMALLQEAAMQNLQSLFADAKRRRDEMSLQYGARRYG